MDVKKKRKFPGLLIYSDLKDDAVTAVEGMKRCKLVCERSTIRQ